MARKSTELLLLKTVEALGIVGDIVKVKPGFARNFLLPNLLAEFPTKRKIEALKEARAKALAEQAALRSARESLLARMEDVKVSIQRACNDQGLLYGSVTQRDVADALQAAGYDVGVRSIRMIQPIRRVGEYTIPVQFERDLRTDVTLAVLADRALEEEKPDMDFDNEGNLIENKPQRSRRRKSEAEATAETPAVETDDAQAEPAAPKARKKAAKTPSA